MSDIPIDTLIIDIEAKASDADKAIDKFANAIGNLANSLARVDTGKLNSVGNGIKKLSDSLQTMKSIDTRSINSVVSKINSLSAIDTSKFATVSANLHQMANGIQSLGTVSAQGSKVGSASNSIVKGLNKASTSATRARGSFKGLASAFGKFYANYFLVIRGVKSLWKSINSTADYLEAFNYFEVALNKVGGDWASDWEKYSEKLGVTSAEEYANSFKTRLNENLKGLSGVQISVDADGKTGLLTDTGMKNLGLNIQEVTQYASQLASVTNSVGQTGEVTLATASAFTKLGADMSSLFNVDYSSVMNNLQSGLIGQSRALYKYGIDITNATLQTYAYKVGVTKAVSEMTQAEKMQLRMITILDQSRVSWGDQANTINSLSNSIRQFKNNISEAGQILGQLFAPIMSKIMPIVNGATIAIKRLMVSIAGLMGVKLNLSEFGQSSNDISDDVYDLSDSLDNATTAAENLKKATTTLGIDELNINSPQTDTSSSSSSGSTGGSLDLTDSILKAADEYEKAWQEAYNRMENQAITFADRIEKALEPIKKIFQDFAVGDYFQAGQDVSKLVVNITDFFANAIDNVDWYGIGRKIGDFLAGIEWLKVFKSVGNLMWQGLKAAFELAIGVFDSAPLETALVALATMPKWLKAITASKFVTGFKKLASAIKLVTSGLTGNKKAIKQLINQYPKLGKAVDVASGSIWALKTGISDKNFGTGINLAIENIRNNLTGLQKGAITAIAGFAEFRIVKTSFEDIAKGSENVVASIAKIAGAVGIAAAAMYTALGPAGVAITAVTGLVAAIKGIRDAEKELIEQSEIEKYGDTLANVVEGINETSDAVRERAETSIEYVQTAGLAETQLAKDLAGKYFDLAEKENLTNEEKEQMNNLAKALVETYPDLEKYYDSETGLLNTTRESVEKLINTRLQEIKLSAVEEKLKEAYSDQGDQLEVLADAIEIANDAQEEMNGLKENYQELAEKQDSLEEYYRLSDEIIGCSDDTTELLERQQELWNELTDNGKEPLPTFESIGTKLNVAEQEILDFQKKVEETGEAVLNATTAYEAIGSNIEKLAGMITSGMYEAAGYAVEGYADGVIDGKEVVDRAYELIAQSGIDTTKEIDEIHSPSKVYRQLGAYTIEGYNLGITDSQNSTIFTIKNFVNSATNSFGGIVAPMYSLGSNAMQGLYNGLSSMENSLYKKAESIANNIADTVKGSLDIHSPSRVMAELGKYTIEGFREGMESLYEPTIKSLKAFSYNVEVAPVPELPSYTSYAPKTLVGFEYENSAFESSNTGNSEALLREQNELLRAILDKNVSVKIGDRQIVESYNRGRARMGYSFT